MQLLETCVLICWIVIAACMLYLTVAEIFRKIKDHVNTKQQEKRDREDELFDLKLDVDLLKEKLNESKNVKGL